MLRFLHALVFALAAVFGIASGAHALGSETALRGNFATAQDHVGAFGSQGLGTRQQNPAVLTTLASDSPHAARGAGQVGYHATRAENVASILENGLRESIGGRAGQGVYVSSSVEGALAEFAAHNPGVTPAVLEVGYTQGTNYFLEGLNNPYIKGQLSVAADTLSFYSVRLGEAVNTVIRNGSAAVLRVVQ